MDDIFQLLFHSMVILKEMQELSITNNYDVKEQIEKQNELNRTIVDILKLMVFKKEWQQWKLWIDLFIKNYFTIY